MYSYQYTGIMMDWDGGKYINIIMCWYDSP
jgi:hypothetical protein